MMPDTHLTSLGLLEEHVEADGEGQDESTKEEDEFEKVPGHVPKHCNVQRQRGSPTEDQHKLIPVGVHFISYTHCCIISKNTIKSIYLSLRIRNYHLAILIKILYLVAHKYELYDYMPLAKAVLMTEGNGLF